MDSSPFKEVLAPFVLSVGNEWQVGVLNKKYGFTATRLLFFWPGIDLYPCLLGRPTPAAVKVEKVDSWKGKVESSANKMGHAPASSSTTVSSPMKPGLSCPSIPKPPTLAPGQIPNGKGHLSLPDKKQDNSVSSKRLQYKRPIQGECLLALWFLKVNNMLVLSQPTKSGLAGVEDVVFLHLVSDSVDHDQRTWNVCSLSHYTMVTKVVTLHLTTRSSQKFSCC